MNKATLYFNSRKKSYLVNTLLFITGFIIVIFLFGPPKHYVVPILSILVSYGFVELVGYRSWKKENQ